MLTYFAAFMSDGGQSLWEKIAAWYQNSFIHEILTYLSERYFTVEFGTYENFSVSSGLGSTVRNIVLALAAGFIVAAIMTAHTRVGLGGFVRKLLSTESLSPDSAKTLSELGYFRNATIRRELSRGSSLRMVVRCREEEEYNAAQPEKIENSENGETSSKEGEVIGEGKTAKNAAAPFKIDFLTAHFYIPEELRYRADVRFDRKGSDWKFVIGVVVLSIIAAAVLCWFMPDLLQLADNFISIMSPES